MRAAGMLPLAADESAPENSSHTVYRVSETRGGSVRGGVVTGAHDGRVGWPAVAGPVVPDPEPGSPW
jgi:hypothetical protein